MSDVCPSPPNFASGGLGACRSFKFKLMPDPAKTFKFVASDRLRPPFACFELCIRSKITVWTLETARIIYNINGLSKIDCVGWCWDLPVLALAT